MPKSNYAFIHRPHSGTAFISGRFEGIAEKLGADLRRLGPNKPVCMYLDSTGGDAGDGMDVYRLLDKRQGVRIIVTGYAGSAASLPLCACRVKATRDSRFLLHHPYFTGIGRADRSKLTSMANRLSRTEGVMLSAYSAKTHMTWSTLRSLMADNTWLSATRAQALGLVDEVLNWSIRDLQHAEKTRFFSGGTKELYHYV